MTSPSSRPASFISVEESSASERNQESEDDVGKTKLLTLAEFSSPNNLNLECFFVFAHSPDFDHFSCRCFDSAEKSERDRG